jgi:hypothetical protein
MRVTERAIDKKGQALSVPELEIEGWWTSLVYPDEEIKDLQCGLLLSGAQRGAG